MNLERRTCVRCGNPFKVMVGSKVEHCGSECAKKGGLWGKETERTTTVSTTSPKRMTLSGERSKESADESGPKVTPIKLEPRPTEGITETKPNGTPERSNGKETTESTSNPIEGTIMQKTESTSVKSLTPAGTGGTPAVSSDESRGRLERVALDSMKLLQQSGNKLMQLIDESVSSQDLEKAADGVQRVESHRIETAINAANALAQTVQTQVNMVKAVTDFKRHLGQEA